MHEYIPLPALLESIAENAAVQVDKHFNQIFAYFNAGIVILGILITVFGLRG